MIFHSLDFLLFFLCVLFVYWCLNHRTQNIFLLLSSYFFYGYIHPWFLLLILTSTVVDYLCGLGMLHLPHKKKRFLITSVATNLGMLAGFKYFNFFIENISTVLTSIGIANNPSTLTIILPVGISFYTFQTLSYTIDIYKCELEPRKNIIDFSLFVAFFPQLVAGPIERAKRLLPQIEASRTFSPKLARSALLLILWGFFKKLVIADNVAIIANKTFLLDSPPFPLLWAGVFAFCIQIYADFSAYSDIARGVARLLGFDLVKNFNHPYLATSPSDFWRRWHISLSNWLRDYLYLPLGGSRCRPLRNFSNLFITFFLCGLWHGASWNFVLWGLFHGGMIFSHRILKNHISPFIHTIPGIKVVQLLVMFAITNVGWLIFRETNLDYLLHYLTLSPFQSSLEEYQVALFIFAKVLIYSLPLWVHSFLEYRHTPYFGIINTPDDSARYFLGQSLLSILLFTGILLYKSQHPSQFIYFQF